MALQNISKYVQLNDFLLLEYEFNRNGESIDLSNLGATIAINNFGNKQYFNNNKSYALGSTNNILELNSIPTNINRNNWYNNYNNISDMYNYFTEYDSSIGLSTTSYPHDNIKIHVVSGYNFDDVAGFLLQIRANDSSDNLVDLSNFTYFKQPDALGSSKVIKFSSNALQLGNKFYDKYVQFSVPSVYQLGVDKLSSLGTGLDIQQLSDVYITYNTIPNLQSDYLGNNTFVLADHLDLQLPVTSVADNFNIFIAESTSGDYIEYYATWDNNIIGNVMSDIESGRIPLYTSNNPNDNYETFSNTYGVEAAKWILIHELNVYENIPNITGGTALLTQKFSFTQDNNFSISNKFRPVIQNADIAASYTIQYICRLTNRMDGTQIIRSASFSSTNPKKYGMHFNKLNVENVIPYKVFNKITNNNINPTNLTSNVVTKYVKVYYDTTNILFDQDNNVYPQGTGPLFLKRGDSIYMFKFEMNDNIKNNYVNVDLSGAYNYALVFTMDDDSEIKVSPTYSTNMNTSIGELEFKLSKEQISKILKQSNNNYSIFILNPDGTKYIYYTGLYYDYNNYDSVMSQYLK